MYKWVYIISRYLNFTICKKFYLFNIPETTIVRYNYTTKCSNGGAQQVTLMNINIINFKLRLVEHKSPRHKLSSPQKFQFLPIAASSGGVLLEHLDTSVAKLR